MTSQIEPPDSDRPTATEPGQAAGYGSLRNPGAGDPAAERDFWTMMADVSQSLQMSSASIKAAITSLLDNTIIWDRSVQHEFMVSINESIDRSFPLIAAMTLAMKSEGGALDWVIERCSIQEILSRVVDALKRDGVETPITLSLPDEGKPVLVDYDYLRIALKMLLDALFNANGARPIALHIRAEEDVSHWRVYFEGRFSRQAAELIAWLAADSEQRRSFPGGIHSEIMLKAFTASRMLNQQQIELSVPAEIPAATSFMLIIPSIGN